jgi:hypothetical protein
MILSYSGYKDLIAGRKVKEDRLTSVETQLKALISAMGSIGESAKTEIEEN